MAIKPLPDQATLLKLLRYEPETGKLFWLARPPEMFSDGGIGRSATHQAWNRRYPDTEAAPCQKPKGARGYRQINLCGRKYLVHRVIWKMVTGQEPPEVDHISGDKADNKWRNLRASDTVANKKNMAMQGRNKSGCTGVFWNNQLSRWQAFISVGKKRKHLGVHKDRDAAIRARKAAERHYGYGPNHGRKRNQK